MPAAPAAVPSQVGLFMALTLHFGNLVYLHLTVAYVQILKASRDGAVFLSCCLTCGPRWVVGHAARRPAPSPSPTVPPRPASLPLQAFTPIITMLALFVARLETPTRKLILSVSFIALGTALASAGEVNFSLLGMFIMFLSELFESVRLVMTQLLLTGLRFHPSERGGVWNGLRGRRRHCCWSHACARLPLAPAVMPNTESCVRTLACTPGRA